MLFWPGSERFHRVTSLGRGIRYSEGKPLDLSPGIPAALEPAAGVNFG
jgi:hypothetical protein